MVWYWYTGIRQAPRQCYELVNIEKLVKAPAPANLRAVLGVCPLHPLPLSMQSRADYFPCFSDGRQLELLLRQIYRPHNSYCLHIDPRSDKLFKSSARNIINCYERGFERKNMFLLENPINVTWSHISMLEADLLCIKVRREHFYFSFFFTISILSARLFLTSFLLGSLL